MKAMSPAHDQREGELALPADLVAVFLVVAVFCLSIFAFSDRLLSDPDTYWHIETGRWMWTEHQFPRTEIFSHTAVGQPWTDMEWLSQIVLFLSYELLGWHGPYLLAAFVIALTFTLMFWLLARRLRATVALGIAVIAFIFANNHFLARPHLLSFPIIVVWAAVLAKACDEGRRPSFWLLPVMTLWANLHGAFTLGLVMAGGFAFDAVVSAPAAARLRLAFDWLIFGIGATLAGCITPYGYQYIVETVNVFDLGPVLQQNSEWRPMDADNDRLQEAILLVALLMAITFGAKIRFTRALLVVGILHLGFRHVRGLPMVALSWPFMLAGPLQAQFAFLRPTTDPHPLFDAGRRRALPALVGITAAVIAVAAIGTAYMRLQPNLAPAVSISPRAAVDYAVQHDVNGPVFNDFDFGGYLIHRGIKTFIDGRTLPFGKKFAVDYFDAAQLQNLPRLDAMVDAYKVTWTLLRPNTTFAYYFDHSPAWRRIYADDTAVVHVRR